MTDPTRLRGEIAIVTGGGAGIGRATVLRLAEEGAAVGIATRTASQAHELVQILGEMGAPVSIAIGDLAQADFIQEAYDTFTRELGPATVIVNNVAVGLQSPFLESTDEHFERVFAVNFFAAVRLTRLALPAMIERGKGSVINVSSVQGLFGWPNHAAYSASKGGIVGMTLPIARDLASLAIRVMTIAPGLFRTPLLSIIPEEAQDALGAQVPHPARLGHPDEFARLVSSIIENPMLNGEVIRLDGALRLPPR